MLQVNLLQVIQGDIIFPLSVSLLDPLADLRAALDVDYSFKIDDVVCFDEVFVELKVDGVLRLVEDVRIAHDAGEDLAVF